MIPRPTTRSTYSYLGVTNNIERLGVGVGTIFRWLLEVKRVVQFPQRAGLAHRASAVRIWCLIE